MSEEIPGTDFVNDGGPPHKALVHRKNYNQMEIKEAKRDGVTPVRNSGRGKAKGDARDDEFLIDYKFNAKSFTLTSENWKKLTRQAWKESQRSPLIIVCFEDGTKLGIIDYQYIQENSLGKVEE